MRNYYLKNRSDQAKQQEQINNVLRVYDFLGQQNRKKPIPTNIKQTSPKKGEYHEKIQ